MPVYTSLRTWCEQRPPEHMLFIWLTALTLYRIGCLFQGHMGLYYDEAYYVHWSQTLDWGYYSKPPMVAWLIAISTHLFGQTDVAAKIFSPLLYSATAVVIYYIAKALTDHKTLPLIAAVVFSSTLLVGFNSMFITTDAGLYFFWSLTCLCFVWATRTNRLHLWIALGVCLGLGMLCKYTFAALPLGLMLFLAISKQWQYFVSPKAWLAAGIGLCLFSLNLWWNWQHDFVSFNHTREIAQLNGPLIKPGALAEFLLTQVLIFGIAWVVLIAKKRTAIASSFKQQNAVLFLICASIPILAIIATQALLSRAFANWAGPFVVTASIIAAAALVHTSKKVLLTAIAAHLILLSAFYHWPPILATLDIEQSKKNSPYFRLSGWRELTETMQPTLAENPAFKYLSDSRELLAYIGFYSNKHVSDLVYWNPNKAERVANHYDLKNNLGEISDYSQPFFFLAKGEINADIAKRFNAVIKLGTFEYAVSEHILRKVTLYNVSGFKGYSDTSK